MAHRVGETARNKVASNMDGRDWSDDSEKENTPRLVERNRNKGDFSVARTHFGDAVLAGIREQLEWIDGEWDQERTRLQKKIGPEEYERLICLIGKMAQERGVDLPAAEEMLKEILARKSFQDMLHGEAKRITKWDAHTKQLLRQFDIEQDSPNIMNGAKQSVLYGGWALLSLVRLALQVANSLQPSTALKIGALVSTILVPVIAAIHTGTMIRDDLKTRETLCRERAKAFSNSDAVIRFLFNPAQATPWDSRAFLDFLDAMKKVPQFSKMAKVEARKTESAAQRETRFLPANLLVSTLAQIVSLLDGPRYASASFFLVSAASYFGQSWWDNQQGNAEEERANMLSAKANNLKGRLDPDSLAGEQAQGLVSAAVVHWAAGPKIGPILSIVQRHLQRTVEEQSIEQRGAVARNVKGALNLESAMLSLVTSGMQFAGRWTDVTKYLPVATSAFISANTAWYMPFTGHKMYKRWDAGHERKHRQQDAQLLRALAGPGEISMAFKDPGATLKIRVPVGAYDEASGFQYQVRQVEVGSNEHLALRKLARMVARGCEPGIENHPPIFGFLEQVCSVPKEELWALSNAASGIRNMNRRTDFIQNRISGHFLTEFKLDAAGREATLPPQVMVELAIDALVRERAIKKRLQPSEDRSVHAALGKNLYQSLANAGLFMQFDAEDLVAAYEQVKEELIPSAETTRAKTRFYHLALVADHVKRIRDEAQEHLKAEFAALKANALIARFGTHHVQRFVEYALQWHGTDVTDREKRAALGGALSRMKMTQSLLRELNESESRRRLKRELPCFELLATFLGKVDIDRISDLEEYPDDRDEIVNSYWVGSGKSGPDQDSTLTSESDESVITTIAVPFAPKAPPGNESAAVGANELTKAASGALSTDAEPSTPRGGSPRLISRIRHIETRKRELTSALRSAVSRHGSSPGSPPPKPVLQEVVVESPFPDDADHGRNFSGSPIQREIDRRGGARTGRPPRRETADLTEVLVDAGNRGRTGIEDVNENDADNIAPRGRRGSAKTAVRGRKRATPGVARRIEQPDFAQWPTTDRPRNGKKAAAVPLTQTTRVPLEVFGESSDD